MTKGLFGGEDQGNIAAPADFFKMSVNKVSLIHKIGSGRGMAMFQPCSAFVQQKLVKFLYRANLFHISPLPSRS